MMFDLYEDAWKLDAGEIVGAYQIKVTTSALVLLLSTQHPEMSKINVEGHLLKVYIFYVIWILSLFF